MPAARYWRITAIETYSGIGLELSEVALHTSAGRVDGSATLTSVIAPSTGALASLGDAAFTPTVTWAESAARLAGFALVYDFGTDTDIVKVGVAGPSQEAFAHKFAVDYSADGVVWTRLLRPAVAAKWPGSAAFYELDTAQADTALAGLVVTTRGDSASRSLWAFERNGDIFSELAFPYGAFDDHYRAGISPDGKYVAMGSNNSLSYRNYFNLQLRDAKSFYDVSKFWSFSNLVYGATFAANGTHAVFMCASTPVLHFYKIENGAFTKLADPATQPSTGCTNISFSQDSAYLAVGGPYSPFLHLYRRDGDVLTRLSNPAELPANEVRGASWGVDSTYLALVSSGIPNLIIYKRSGDVFTRLTTITGALNGSGYYGCAFSPDGTYLAISGTQITIYKRDGDNFTKIASPSEYPSSSDGGCAFSPDGNYLAVCSNSLPCLYMYKRSGDVFNRISFPDVTVSASGVAWFPAVSSGTGMLTANYDATPIRSFEGDTTVLGDGNIGDTQIAPLMTVPTFDMEDAGAFRIVGTVKEKNTPANTPLRRRVQLFNQRSGRLIRETWSDAATGAYSFNGIKGGPERYFVVAFDYAENYRAVIADNLQAEAMP